MDRQDYSILDSVAHIRTTLGLPESALESNHLPIDAECYPSSFKVDHLAQASIGVSALAAALYWSIRTKKLISEVTVPAEHACVEFKSERLYVLGGKAASSPRGTIGGLHKTRDGYIRMHDLFPDHRDNALRVLRLNSPATRDDVAKRMLDRNSIDLETEAIKEGAAMAALRTFEEWDALPQSSAVADFPILLSKVARGEPNLPQTISLGQAMKCLQGVRVVEMSRVIAAPVAGKTLAAHGAVSFPSRILGTMPKLVIGCHLDYIALTTRCSRTRHQPFKRKAKCTAQHQES